MPRHQSTTIHTLLLSIFIINHLNAVFNVILVKVYLLILLQSLEVTSCTLTKEGRLCVILHEVWPWADWITLVLCIILIGEGSSSSNNLTLESLTFRCAHLVDLPQWLQNVTLEVMSLSCMTVGQLWMPWSRLGLVLLEVINFLCKSLSFHKFVDFLLGLSEDI